MCGTSPMEVFCEDQHEHEGDFLSSREKLKPCVVGKVHLQYQTKHNLTTRRDYTTERINQEAEICDLNGVPTHNDLLLFKGCS